VIKIIEGCAVDDVVVWGLQKAQLSIRLTM
jgi:hypothetical protein